MCFTICQAARQTWKFYYKEEKNILRETEFYLGLDIEILGIKRYSVLKFFILKYVCAFLFDHKKFLDDTNEVAVLRYRFDRSKS